MQEASQNLVYALEEALSVFEEQHRRVAMARQSAEATHTQLMDILKLKLSGDAVSEDSIPDKRAQFLDNLRGKALRASDLSRQWEQALCDSYEALMRLYAFPDARAATEKIAGLLRAIRLLQVSQEMVTPSFPDQFPAGAVEGETPSENKQQQARQVLDFFGAMEGVRGQVMLSYEEKREQTDSLLQQAIAEARAIAETLPTQ